MLVLLLLALPFVELYLLLALGAQIGFWPTVALIGVTGVAGVSLARREGLRVVREGQRSLARGEMPEQSVLEGVLVLVGGALLMAPGVLTDLAGIVLLIPWTRRHVGRWLAERLQARIARSQATFSIFGMDSPFGRGPFGRGPFGRGPFDPDAGFDPFAGVDARPASPDAPSTAAKPPSKTSRDLRDRVRAQRPTRREPPPAVIDTHGREID